MLLEGFVLWLATTLLLASLPGKIGVPRQNELLLSICLNCNLLITSREATAVPQTTQLASCLKGPQAIQTQGLRSGLGCDAASSRWMMLFYDF